MCRTLKNIVPGIFLAGVCLLAGAAEIPAPDLVVHEWGTFTSLQNGNGETLGGLNIDEEALPPFVHDAMPGILHVDLAPQPGLFFGKGLVVDGSAVTMRLETPVIYFHQPAGAKPVDAVVQVSFAGGVLSQFYPAAQLRTAGAVDEQGHFIVDPLGATSHSTLTWRHVQIGQGAKVAASAISPPPTLAPVWLAPRAVAAADLHAGFAGENERFLFYRGLGHRDAPLKVMRDGDHDHFTVHARGLAPAAGGVPIGDLAVPAWWVVDIREDGATAFRELTAATIGSNSQAVVTEFSGEFAASDYAAPNRATLVARMHAALCIDGLFADEATALLTTWEASYFRSPGLRLFFLVPRSWTDAVLPLRVTSYGGGSLPHTLVRTMVGRIELVSHRQRDLLATIATHAGERDEFGWWSTAVKQHFGDSQAITVEQEREFLLTLLHEPTAVRGVSVPPAYSAYMALGRFRAALVGEAARRPALVGLNGFMSIYGIY